MLTLNFFGGVKVLFLANFGRTAVKFASKMRPLSSQVKKIPFIKSLSNREICNVFRRFGLGYSRDNPALDSALSSVYCM